MANILVNGTNAKVGGGKSILNNYLRLLKQVRSADQFFVLTPSEDFYRQYSCDFIHIVDIDKVFKTGVAVPFLYFGILSRLVKKYNIDCIFNLGDLVVSGNIPQVYLFDWPYAIYRDSIAWKMMSVRDYVIRRVKLFLFSKSLKYATIIISQTETAKRRLMDIYNVTNVEVVPNAVSLENLSSSEPFDFGLPKDKFKLLCLTYYYTHKNIEIFLPLARMIKEKRMPYCIVVTLDPYQHGKVKDFLDSVRREALSDVFINVGSVPMHRVPSLYVQTDALLMPTLLESFSGTYVEAMFHERPILTSDLDFAIDVCGEAAFYFDPLNPQSILNSIDMAYSNPELRKRKTDEGRTRLSQMPSWEEVFHKYQRLIAKATESM